MIIIHDIKISTAIPEEGRNVCLYETGVSYLKEQGLFNLVFSPKSGCTAK
jgi:hypothetical protein